MATEAGVETPGEVSGAFKRLGRHDIGGRYPDAHASGPPDRHHGETDARQAIEDADAVLRFVDSSWRELHG